VLRGFFADLEDELNADLDAEFECDCFEKG
jgi:hypothetical protein